MHVLRIDAAAEQGGDPQVVAALPRSRPRGVVVITAIVLVHVAADRIPEAAQAIADLDGVNEVYSCAGDVDLIAMVKVAQHEQLADVIAGRLSKVDGVRSTDTHIAFRSWSRADTEATFDVGLDS
jgi:DNA-binding Lrp family transcriptional regulator